MTWHELVPTDVERHQCFLSPDNLTQVHHAEVVESSLDKRQLAQIIFLTHASNQLISGSPDELGVDQVQLLQVVRQASLHHI